jgi:hypothetical protein
MPNLAKGSGLEDLYRYLGVENPPHIAVTILTN